MVYLSLSNTEFWGKEQGVSLYLFTPRAHSAPVSHWSKPLNRYKYSECALVCKSGVGLDKFYIPSSFPTSRTIRKITLWLEISLWRCVLAGKVNVVGSP